ncbi:histone-lysine N-methyltransferase SETMAR-like [Halyomorpha halys]|uniref:histone-lysine N-methyltransferase SETMAR-like n=1 Tax=Halyomorpha halys TaxID=286706 RepID=UPI0034D263D9
MDINEVLQEAVESNLFTSTRKLTKECGVSKDSYYPSTLHGEGEKRAIGWSLKNLLLSNQLRGVIHHEFVPDECSVNSELYCEQLQSLYAKLSERCNTLINQKGVLFLLFIRPHTYRQTKEKFKVLHEFELLPHPPYSLDLAPSEYYLCRPMVHFHQGKKFDNFAEVELLSKSSLTTIPKNSISVGSSNWLAVG